MSMIKKLFAPFVGQGTLFRNKVRTDPFFLARIQIIGLYFLVGTIIFVVFGWTFGYLIRQPFYQVAIYQNGDAVRAAIHTLEINLLIQRLVMLALFAISTYFLTEFVLRPIKKSAELQQRFIATVSHELRTPLAIIKNSSEIALRNPDSLTHEKALALLRSNLEETDRLSDTIRFLLTFSMLQNRRRMSEMNYLPLIPLAQNVITRMETEAQERNITLTLEDSQRVDIERESLIRGNATALEGLIVNLVKNAISHTPSHGVVTIKIEQGARGIKLIVQDTGKGISKKDMPYIFKPFYQGEPGDADDDTAKGSGLGLSIVKEVAELHRASVTVASEVGKGSTFTVHFPLPPHVSYPH